MNIRLDINGDEVEVGDLVHCFDGRKGEETASLRGIVTDEKGVIFVGGNELAIGCSEHVEIISKDI